MKQKNTINKKQKDGLNTLEPIKLKEELNLKPIEYVEMKKPLPKYKFKYWVRVIKERDRKIKVMRFIKKAEKTIKAYEKIKNSEEQLKHESVIKSTELKDIVKNQIELSFVYKSFLKKYSVDYWVQYYKEKYLKKRLFLIVMQLRNGKYDIFTTATNKEYFERMGGMYYIDTDMSREDLHTKLNLLYYHQDISSPFRIDFNLSEIHKLVETDEDMSIDKALNPSSLKGFINSQVIEKVLKGQELSDEMKFLKILMVINLILTLIVGFMVGKGMGWF